MVEGTAESWPGARGTLEGTDEWASGGGQLCPELVSHVENREESSGVDARLEMWAQGLVFTHLPSCGMGDEVVWAL